MTCLQLQREYLSSGCHYRKSSTSFRQKGHPSLGRGKLYEKTIQFEEGDKKKVVWEDIQL